MTAGVVLLTGASGFLALHILDELLKNDFSVIATVRNEAKAKDVGKVVAKLGHDSSRVEYSYIADIAESSAYDETLKSHPEITHVLHTATPFILDPKDYRDLLVPTLEGTVNILKAVKAHASQVSHVVLTASIVGMLDLTAQYEAGTIITEKSWNGVTVEGAKANGLKAYSYAKTQGEQAFWKFFEDEKPSFVGTTINPPYIFGPVLGNVTKAESLNTSSGFLYNSVLTDNIPQDSSGYLGDARDVAAAHVLALKKPKVSAGKRWYIGPHQFVVKDLVEAATRVQVPKYAGKVRKADDSVDSKAFLSSSYSIDWSATEKDIGRDIKFRTIDETIRDSFQSFADLGL